MSFVVSLINTAEIPEWLEGKLGNKSARNLNVKNCSQRSPPPNTYTHTHRAGGRAAIPLLSAWPQWVHSSRLLPAQNSNQSRGLSVPPAFPCLTYSLPQTRSTHSLTPPSPALPLYLPWTKGADDPSKLIRSLPTPFFRKKKLHISTPLHPFTALVFPLPKISNLRRESSEFYDKKEKRLPGDYWNGFLCVPSLWLCGSIRLSVSNTNCQYVPRGQFVWKTLRRLCPAAATKSTGWRRRKKRIITWMTDRQRGKVRKEPKFRLIRDAF